MNAGAPDDSLSPSQFLRLDEVCNRFEARWKAGQQPQIEDYLDAGRQSQRSELLRELLLLDIEYRTEDGRHPSAAEYKSRFPQHAELIDDAFRKFPVGRKGRRTGAINPRRGLCWR